MQYHIFRALRWKLLIYTRTKIYSVTWVILHETGIIFQPLKRQCLRELRRLARDWFLCYWQERGRIMVSISFCAHTLTVIDAPWSMFRTCTLSSTYVIIHDDVIKGKHFPRYWPFLWGVHPPPMNSPQKGQWPARWSYDVFFDLCLNKWLSKQRDSSDFIHHCAHYDITVMYPQNNMWNIGNKSY